MKKSRAAIAELNVLRSSDTEPEKSEKYKQCINDVLPDVEALEIICAKTVNMSLIKSLKTANDYNSMASLDPNRHLTPYEFKVVKNAYKQYLADKAN